MVLLILFACWKAPDHAQIGDSHLRGPILDLDAAATAYNTACEAGNFSACARLGLLVQDGRGVPRDVERAAKLYEEACAGGVGVGCFNLAGMALGAVRGHADPAEADRQSKRARDRYQTACDSGDLAEGCLNLGVLYESGMGVDRDLKRAAQIYRAACDQGHGDSCVNLALQMAYGEPPDPAAAIALLKPICSDAEPLACDALGGLYFQNLDPQTDVSTAIALVERGCDGGVRHACVRLGALYALGDPVPVDLARSRSMMIRACDLGSSEGCFAAGLDVEAAESVTWFERGCQIGNPRSCTSAGAQIIRGALGSPSKAFGDRAVALLNEGCRMGDPGACDMLLDLNQRLPLDEKTRTLYLKSACGGGLFNACKRLSEP